MAIHIRFKVLSRKMYFIVHFSFDTQTFGFQYSFNMENNKKKYRWLIELVNSFKSLNV